MREGHVRRGLRRQLRVWTDGLLAVANAFLDSLINALAAAAMPVAGIDRAKEAKEIGEGILSVSRR